MDASPNPQALSLLEDIARVGKLYSQNGSGSREELLSLAYSLASSVELPSEAIQRIGWAEPARFASTKIAIDLKLFEELKDKKGTGMTTMELAKASKADPTLICKPLSVSLCKLPADIWVCAARVMKHLRAMNVIGEKNEDHYVATPFSIALTDSKYRDGIVYTHDVAGPSFQQLPAYLQSISYVHPTNIADGPFQYAHKTPAPFFVWLYERPELASCFNNYMSGYRAGKPSWVDPGFYPVEERLCNCMKQGKGEVWVVDVGGGLGHDLELLKQKYPHVPGRLVLQDKQEVIDQIPASETGFEKTAHDFFTPQPVKGARAYHLHSVLHDWDDASSINILKNIVTAMEKDYSKLLINELVVPNKDASWSITSMDWLMLALGAVKERTEKDWRTMVEAAGLKITGMWTKEVGSESLIECELA
ncbi:MAG: hypothetical protein Q9187_008819 [Circinaria calcarea]